MTTREWWTYAKGLRPNWQLVLFTLLLAAISWKACLGWAVLWIMIVIGHGIFDPRITEAVRKRIGKEDREAAHMRDRDAGP